MAPVLPAAANENRGTFSFDGSTRAKLAGVCLDGARRKAQVGRRAQMVALPKGQQNA